MSNIYQDHYHVLGLHRDATESLIKNSFRKLSLQWHPDKNICGSEQFLKINNAYRVLIDPKKRASYDHSTLKTKSQRLVHPSEDFIVSDIITRRDRYYLSMGNFEQPNRFFPIPNPGEPNQDDFYEKLKVAVCIGGVLLAYVTYKIYRGYHPPMPVPEAVIPQVVPQEFSEMHPASLWTLISWLAALRSKTLSRLGKLTSGPNIRLTSKTLNASLSSTANVVAKTVTQKPQAAILSATSTTSLTSAANVVAKSLTEKQIELNHAAEIVAKTLTQGSQAGISSASKTVVAKTLTQGSQNGPFNTADYVTKKTFAGLLKYWKQLTESVRKGSASTFSYTVSPSLTSFTKATGEGVGNGWKWAVSKTTLDLGSPQRYINRATLDKATKVIVTNIVPGSSSVLYSAARSTIKYIKTGTSKARSMLPVNFFSVMPLRSAFSSAPRVATEGLKKPTPSYRFSSKTQTAAPACEFSPSSPSSPDLPGNQPKTSTMVRLGVCVTILIPLCVSAYYVIAQALKLYLPGKAEIKLNPLESPTGYVSAANNLIKKTSAGVYTG